MLSRCCYFLIVVQHCAGELGTNIFTPFGGIGVAVFLLWVDRII